MPLVLVFVIQMVVLFFLSRALNNALFTLFYRLSHSEHVAVSGTTLLLFPGTVIHELAHLFIAEIMGVRTGKLTLVPEFVEKGRIQAGSVEVTKTDPFRRTIIGLAPLFVGVIAITLISSYLARLFPTALAVAESTQRLKDPTLYLFSLAWYFLFAVSNNMFPSKEDLRGVPPVLILLAMIIIAAYVVGMRFTLSGQAATIVASIISSLTTNLTVVIVLNFIIYAGVRVMLLMKKR